MARDTQIMTYQISEGLDFKCNEYNELGLKNGTMIKSHDKQDHLKKKEDKSQQ